MRADHGFSRHALRRPAPKWDREAEAGGRFSCAIRSAKGDLKGDLGSSSAPLCKTPRRRRRLRWPPDWAGAFGSGCYCK